MGAIGGLLGLGGGSSGTNYSINPGTNANQINTSYNQNQALLSALQGQNGLGNQNQVYGQLQNVAQGQGPNPAQAMLNQATGANVANQASLAAGQRGAASNVGLMSRQAAQTGAGLQQQAAGQGATMQAQQSLGALGQAGQMANTQAGQQIGATQNEQQMLQNANTSANQANAALAAQQMQGQQGLLGGIGNAIGAATGLIGGKSGLTALMADGGQVNPQMRPTSMFGQAILGQQPMMMATGGEVPVILSPGEKTLKPNEAKAVAEGRANPMKVGGTVPGKAKVAGDSLKNDTYETKLPPGSIVIPRSVVNSKNPGVEAKRFVDAYMAKKKVKK